MTYFLRLGLAIELAKLNQLVEALQQSVFHSVSFNHLLRVAYQLKTKVFYNK